MDSGSSLIKDLKDEQSELHAWLLQNNFKEFISLLLDLKKLDLSNQKFISNILVAITEGFQPINEKFSIFSMLDILNLNTTDKEMIYRWSADKDSYFSVWFEIKGDKKKYDIWWSKRIENNYEHWDAMLLDKLINYDNFYFTENSYNEYISELNRIQEEERILKEKKELEAIELNRVQEEERILREKKEFEAKELKESQKITYTFIVILIIICSSFGIYFIDNWPVKLLLVVTLISTILNFFNKENSNSDVNQPHITNRLSHLIEQNVGNSTVILVHFGVKKIDVIKLVREFTGLGLKETKDLVESGGILLNKINGEEALRVRDSLVELGAKVEIREE
jgi:ribosomal protein L7/L12